MFQSEKIRRSQNERTAEGAKCACKLVEHFLISANTRPKQSDEINQLLAEQQCSSRFGIQAETGANESDCESKFKEFKYDQGKVNKSQDRQPSG